MTEKQVIHIMQNKLAAQTTTLLKEIIEQLMNKPIDGDDLTFTLTLKELERRLPKDDFIQYCNEL